MMKQTTKMRRVVYTYSQGGGVRGLGLMPNNWGQDLAVKYDTSQRNGLIRSLRSNGTQAENTAKLVELHPNYQADF